MKTVYPDYLPEFRCSAGACRHTCCVGWEIDIDPESLKRFRSAGGAHDKKLKENIEEDENGAHFVLAENERCPFLAADGLCELITEYGEDFLCNICADHPRFRNFYYSGTETGLGLCCEEACRLILSKKAPPVMLTEGEYSGEPDEYEDELLLLREKAFTLLAQGNEPISSRVKAAAALFGARAPEINEELITLLFGLERLDPLWDCELKKLEGKETGSPAEFETELTRLAEYFFFRHMGTAADDGEHTAHAAFASLCYGIVEKIFVNTENRSFGTLCETARMFSGEIEYSDLNLEALLDYCLSSEERE